MTKQHVCDSLLLKYTKDQELQDNTLYIPYFLSYWNQLIFRGRPCMLQLNIPSLYLIAPQISSSWWLGVEPKLYKRVASLAISWHLATKRLWNSRLDFAFECVQTEQKFGCHHFLSLCGIASVIAPLNMRHMFLLGEAGTRVWRKKQELIKANKRFIICTHTLRCVYVADGCMT